MTSKEALEFIIETFNKYANKPNDIGLFFKFCEAHEKVKKDLERLKKQDKILDQLKEILSMDYLVRVYGYDMAKRLQTYLKSNDAVKNWLEKRDN